MREEESGGMFDGGMSKGGECRDDGLTRRGVRWHNDRTFGSWTT
jgi:hypothetical protein